MLTGVDLGQQQLEYRFVRRFDALEQLPQASTDELAGWDLSQGAEVQCFVGANETLGDQGMGVRVVACLFVNRDQPPQWRAPGEPDGGAVKLIQQ
ncbi:hypothetical protein D3C80_1200380 [compost metagenome]